jgi:hypothetical protein
LTAGDNGTARDGKIGALDAGEGDVAFLKGHVDMMRLGISGHSQGACMAATLSTLPNVQIVLPMDGSTSVSPSDSLKSIIYITASRSGMWCALQIRCPRPRTWMVIRNRLANRM